MIKWALTIIFLIIGILSLSNSFYIKQLPPEINEAKFYLIPLPISVGVDNTMMPMFAQLYLYLGIIVLGIAAVMLFLILRKRKNTE